MMNEFEQKDYDSARSYADGVGKNADNIMGIFDSIDKIMTELYGDNWESCGADNAHDRYNEIRKNYEIFYDQVVKMKEHVYSVTQANEEADAAADQTISSIG